MPETTRKGFKIAWFYYLSLCIVNIVGQCVIFARGVYIGLFCTFPTKNNMTHSKKKSAHKHTPKKNLQNARINKTKNTGRLKWYQGVLSCIAITGWMADDIVWLKALKEFSKQRYENAKILPQIPTLKNLIDMSLNIEKSNKNDSTRSGSRY